MKRALAYVALVAVSMGWLLVGTTVTQAQKVSDTDEQFAKKAASDGMAEVRLGNLALATEQAASAEVKQFGQRMVTDHTQANKELMDIAQQKNITLPQQIDAQHQEAAEELTKLRGDSFDRAFMRQMVTDHEKAVELFSKEAQEGQDADLKAFAAKTLPTLKEHLDMARELAQKQGVSQAR